MTRPLTAVPAPVAAIDPVRRVVHGVELVDDYAWMRADNWREVMRRPLALPKPIRDHLKAENAFSRAWFGPLRGLRARLLKENRGRIKEDDSTVPVAHGSWEYYVRYRESGEHPIVCRRPRNDDAGETVLLDGDALAAGKAFFDLGHHGPSPDHRLLAWSADDTGSELQTIRVRDAATGDDLPDAVEETTGTAVWLSDSSGFYYVRLDEEHRPRRVFLHRLSEPASADRLVYEEGDPGFFVGINETQSRRFLVISVHDHETSEEHLAELGAPDTPLRCVAPRQTGVQYSVEHHGDRLVIRTDADGAEDYKIVETPLSLTGREHWRDLVPHVPGRTILNHQVLARWMVRLEREDGLPRIVAREWSTGAEHQIAFAEEAYALGLSAGEEFDSETVRFVYSSPTTPAETWDYDLPRRERRLRKRQEVPSGHDPDRYVARRLMAPAPDGALVPVTVLMRKDQPLDGRAPLYLYGYGAYGLALPAGFRTAPLSLVDRGVVFAVAHIRGGSDKGRRWYKDGKLGRKPNTFSDFIAAAEHLVAQGYTGGGRIVAHGGSAGGMLIGAVANLRPELFGGLVAEVPFVDVLNTMLDDALPLTPPEWPEWGNPIASAADFAVIRGYSPYDNIGPKPYPPILAIAGLTDPRVTYWEPVKWVAKLRAHTASPAPVLLHVNMTAGHGGAAGRFEALKETAMIQAFVLAVTNAL